jgi:hypothetical protein
MQQLGFDKGLDECCVEQVLRIGVASLAAAGFGWNFFYHDLQRDAFPGHAARSIARSRLESVNRRLYEGNIAADSAFEVRINFHSLLGKRVNLSRLSWRRSLNHLFPLAEELL